MYRVLFQDVLSGVIHGELPAEKLSYSKTLRAPGSAKVTIPLAPTQAHVNRQTVIGGAATAIYIERGPRFAWSGLLWDMVPDYAAGTLELQCEGWLSYFRRRHFLATQTFTQVDQAVIARTLLQHASNYGDGSHLGMLDYGAELHGVKRDRTYKESERKPLGEAVEQLAAVEGGFDFDFVSEWDGSDIWTTFVTQYPAIGRYRPLMLEQGRNCDIPSGTVGGTSVVTHAITTGAGDGPEQLWAVAGSPSPVHPRLESVESYSDVKETTTLQAKADRRVQLGRAPIVLPTIKLYPGVAPGLDEFDLGDALPVRGGYGLVPIEGVWRVTEVSVSVDESGNEDVSLTAASREVFGADE